MPCPMSAPTPPNVLALLHALLECSRIGRFLIESLLEQLSPNQVFTDASLLFFACKQIPFRRQIC